MVARELCNQYTPRTINRVCRKTKLESIKSYWKGNDRADPRALVHRKNFKLRIEYRRIGQHTETSEYVSDCLPGVLPNPFAPIIGDNMK